jgi:energy-coupling factor transport system permease protein
LNRVLHPLAWWIWAGSIAIGIAKASSVLLALATVGAVAIVVARKSEHAPWSKSFQWSLKVGVWVIAIRTLTGILIGVPSAGRTLFTIPQIPLPTWMPGIRIGGVVTAERLAATAHDGIMLASIIALLGAAASLSSPHRLLRSLPVMVYEFGVAVVIATSVLPQLVASSVRIREAQRLRGQNIRGMRGWRRLALPLLEDALSRSLDLAAAMDSRGYGFSRKRSKYRPNSWRLSEYVLCLVALFSVAYPVMTLAAALVALVVVPAQNTYLREVVVSA